MPRPPKTLMRTRPQAKRVGKGTMATIDVSSAEGMFVPPSVPYLFEELSPYFPVTDSVAANHTNCCVGEVSPHSSPNLLDTRTVFIMLASPRYIHAHFPSKSCPLPGELDRFCVCDALSGLSPTVEGCSNATFPSLTRFNNSERR